MWDAAVAAYDKTFDFSQYVRFTLDRFIFSGDGFISNRLMVSRDGCCSSLILTICFAEPKTSVWLKTHVKSSSLSHSVSLSNSMNKFSLYKLWRLVHQSKYFIEYKCEWRALTILSLNLNWWPNSDIIFSSNMNFVSRSAHALKFQNLRFNDNVMLRDLL